MKNDIWRWGLIAFLIVFSSLLYTEIQGYMTTYGVFPAIKALSAKSKMSLSVIFTSFNLICAILTSIVTALPCGYLARKQSRIIAILIIVSMQGIPAYIILQDTTYGGFVTDVWLGQFLTGVISVFVLSELGSRIAAKKQNKEAV